MSWTLSAIRLLHLLSAAALFGSMFYSLTLIQPRAKRFFQSPVEFEEFVAFISHGARWKMLAAFALLAFSGAGMMVLEPHSSSRIWIGFMAAKVAILVALTGLFCVVSWRMWPARVFAKPEEIEAIQRRFRWVGIAMLTMTTAEFVLGVGAHFV